MNLAFAAAFTASIVGAVLAVVDQLSDSTNIETPVYLIILFIALACGYLGHLGFGKFTVN